MTTILAGTLERTVGWFNPGAQRLSQAEVLPSIASAAPRRARPFDLRLRQWLCGARCGHDFILGIDHRRMYLICQTCFHETPGWELGERTPRRCHD